MTSNLDGLAGTGGILEDQDGFAVSNREDVGEESVRSVRPLDAFAHQGGEGKEMVLSFRMDVPFDDGILRRALKHRGCRDRKAIGRMRPRTFLFVSQGRDVV